MLQASLKYLPIMTSHVATGSIKGWFTDRSLPWSDATVEKLDDQGVEYIEDLKLLEPAVFANLFKDQKPIVRAKAKLAWEELMGEVLPAATAMPIPVPVEANDIETHQQAPPSAVEGGVKTIERFSPLAVASIFTLILGLVLGFTCVTVTNMSENCDSRSTYCDWDSMRNEALGTGGAAIILFAVSTTLAFSAGREYLNFKMKREPQWRPNQGQGGCGSCSGGMAIAGWVFFGLTILYDTFIFIFAVAFGEMYEVTSGNIASALVGGCFAWGLMFGYSEMVRRA